MSKIRRQVILARITATPFNNGTLDNVVRTLLEKAKAEAKSLILVLTNASDIEQFHTQVEDADTLVAAIRDELPATFKLEVAYRLASSRLVASILQHGGKPQPMESDAGMVIIGEKLGINADVLLALAASGWTVVVIPPISTKPQATVISNDMFMELLAGQLGTSAVKY